MINISPINIYDLNFSEKQVELLRETKITKEPIVMKVIKRTVFHVPKPGVYQDYDEIILNKGDNFSIRKEKNNVIITAEKPGESCAISLRWNKYLDIKRRKTFLPIAVFAI